MLSLCRIADLISADAMKIATMQLLKKTAPEQRLIYFELMFVLDLFQVRQRAEAAQAALQALPPPEEGRPPLLEGDTGYLTS